VIAPTLLADSTLTVVALALAVCGTALAVVLGGAALLLARERPSPAQIQALVRDANAPLEAMVAQLARALEAPAASSSLFAGNVPRLDDVLRQTVSAARQIGGADAAAVVWEPNGSEPRVVTSGLDETAEHDPAVFRLAGGDTRSVVVTYRHADGARDVHGEAIHAALAVPLKTPAGESAGSLTVFWREPGREPSDDEIGRLEALGARAAAASDRALATP
jgi:GAF domain-containing protein